MKRLLLLIVIIASVGIAAHAEDYQLWINGTQVTSINANNLSLINGVTGTVAYNASTNTLTLNNATLTASYHDNIRTSIDNLKIKVVGTNTLSMAAGSFDCLYNINNMTITGTGTLNCNSPNGKGCYVGGNRTLTIEGGVQANFTGTFGIGGITQYSQLVVSGADTKVTANGSDGCIYNVRVTLNDGLAFTQPIGAHYNNADHYPGVVDANGNTVAGQDLVISLPLYDLWINDTQVTGANISNLGNIGGVSGAVTYSPSDNTLTLDNATLVNSVTNGCCIKSQIDGLTVNLIGSNSLSAQTGIRACAMDVYTTTISGTGTLSAQAKLAGIQTHSGKTITIDNVTDLSASSSKYGIFAASPDNTCILIKGGNTVVHVNGSSGAIRNFKSFVLEDGLAITEPAGCYYNDGILYDADGNVTSNVTISKPSSVILGDLDGSGIVDVDDLDILIKIILGRITPDSCVASPYLTDDDDIDVDDVNAIINIIITQ